MQLECWKFEGPFLASIDIFIKIRRKIRLMEVLIISVNYIKIEGMNNKRYKKKKKSKKIQLE